MSDFINAGEYQYRVMTLLNQAIKIIRIAELENKVEVVVGDIHNGIEIYTRPQNLSLEKYLSLPKHCHVILPMPSQTAKELFFTSFGRDEAIEYLTGEERKVKNSKPKIIKGNDIF